MAEISVIMSVYNGETYLEEAIESIIKQTFGDWELIVINDCSTDMTGEILSRFSKMDKRIRVYTNEVNLRLPASLNKAISMCSGKYIARMDADDICLPDRLEKQYNFMEKHADTALSSCRFMTLKNGIYASGGAGGRCDNDALRAMLLVSNPILHPGVIARAELMRRLKYDESLTCTEDLELWTRTVMANEKIEILPECLLIYRLHDKQITSTTVKKQHEEVQEIQKKYYSAFLGNMSEAMREFYIRGVYFREEPDVHKFLAYAKWLKKASVGSFKNRDISYALLEIMAEYKRRGVSKIDILKAMLTFSPVFLIKENIRRKRMAKKDIENCMKIASDSELVKISGTKKFPIFKKAEGVVK